MSIIAEGPIGPAAPLLRVTGHSVNDPEQGGEYGESTWVAQLDSGPGEDSGSHGFPCFVLDLYDPAPTPPLIDEAVVELTIEGADSAVVEWEVEVAAAGYVYLCERMPDTTLTLELLP